MHWGKVLSTTGSLASTFGVDNPIRYRGYYYDTETGLYYLQSRYYDPDTGRFINADDIAFLGVTGTVLSCNVFAYCENNPVNLVDPTGYYAWYDFYRARWFVSAAINLAISAIIGGAVSAVSKTLQKFIKKWGVELPLIIYLTVYEENLQKLG